MTITATDRLSPAAGRFNPPSPPAASIERTRLDHRYAASTGHLLRVLAPAGYGKTSIVSRWVSSDERAVRWIDVERAENDHVALFETLRSALAGLVEIPRPTTLHGVSHDPCAQALRTAFGDTANESSEPFVLVIDDVHRLQTPMSGWLIDTLVDHLPRSSTVVLVGRGHHDHGSIGRLRLDPGVVDVTVDDLAFDPSECHRLLRSMSIETASPGIERLVDVLDGWPAGIRLAGRALRAGATMPEVADHEALVDYLRAEWTGLLDPDDLPFLREVACLRRCSGEMCDRVLGRSGSADALHRLHRDELVVFPLDQRGRWYRLHPLLSRWLSSDLRRADPTRWAEIHLAAARYWDDEGEIHLAVEHAEAAGDFEVLEQLVVTHGGAVLTRGLHTTVQTWLAAFKPEQVRASVGLCALNCVHALQQGDEIRAVQWERLLDDAIARGGPGDGPPRAWAEVLHAAIDERPAAELIPLAESACRQLAGGPWAAFACWVLGALRFVDGDVDGARRALHAGIFEAELTGDLMPRANCLATLAIVEDGAGDRVLAGALGESAAAAVRDWSGELNPPTATIAAMSALLQARASCRDEAIVDVIASRRGLASFRSVAPWFNIVTRLALLRATLALDDRETSRALMRELDHHSRFEPPPDAARRGCAALIDELRTMVDAMHQPAVGATSLTDAELRVLHHLPTNLSLADIGGRLYLSRNTVKSHATSIYRKLGVGNRTEAVERAVAAGLLDGTGVT